VKSEADDHDPEISGEKRVAPAPSSSPPAPPAPALEDELLAVFSLLSFSKASRVVSNTNGTSSDSPS
jgi:hypothetical protein